MADDLGTRKRLEGVSENEEKKKQRLAENRDLLLINFGCTH